MTPGRVVRRFAGNRIRITPAANWPLAKTSWLKSLSSVSNARVVSNSQGSDLLVQRAGGNLCYRDDVETVRSEGTNHAEVAALVGEEAHRPTAAA